MASRDDLIAVVQAKLEAHEMSVTKTDTGLMVNSVLEAIREVAMEEEGSSLRTVIGTFKRRDYDTRSARNPRTGETVIVPPKSSLVFKAYAPKVEAAPAKKAPAKKAAAPAKKAAPAAKATKAAPAAKAAAPAKKKFALKRK